MYVVELYREIDLEFINHAYTMIHDIKICYKELFILHFSETNWAEMSLLSFSSQYCTLINLQPL